MSSLHDDILKKIQPDTSTRKETQEKIKNFVSILKEKIKKEGIKARITIGGSFAKDSWLANDFDVDLFVIFSQAHKEDDISKLLGKTLKALKARRLHGSRDYYQVTHKGINYEIIPVLAIKKGRKTANVTDNSPAHVNWVKKKLNETLRRDILLAKQFFKAQKIYGAESYIGGYSGHVMDILIIHYKGFEKLLKACQKWTDKTVIDTEKHYRSKKQVLHRLNTSKTQGPLIIVDPVQPERNAAAAVTREKIHALQEAAKKYLKKPTEQQFSITITNIEALRKKKNTIIIEAKALPGKEDVAGAKLQKTYDHLYKTLKEFGVKDTKWEWVPKEKAYYWYTLKTMTLAPTYEQAGPPRTLTQAVAGFKKKHKKTTIKKGRIYATVKRKHTTAEDAIKEALKSTFVQERVKIIKML